MCYFSYEFCRYKQNCPVASPRAVAAIKAQLQDAINRGAHIALGGKIDGNLVYPTVVVNATQDMLGMQNEIFGPVVFVSAFTTDDQLFRFVRDNIYGLRAAIYGQVDKARRLKEKLAGKPYCHPVPEITFGRFGTTAVNKGRSESWIGAFVDKPAGGRIWLFGMDLGDG